MSNREHRQEHSGGATPGDQPRKSRSPESAGQAILVVDDEPAIAAAFGHALRQAGHRVTTATTIDQALAAPCPAVLVADIDLGDCTGLDLLESLRSRGDDPRTVFVSGLPTFDDCRRAMRLGAVEMLQKPFPMEELLRAVDDACALENTNTAAPQSGESPAPVEAQSWQHNYPARAESVERAARDLSAYLLRSCVSPATRARCASALAEVMDNAWRHAGDSTAASPITVRACLTPRNLELTVSDHGLGATAQSLEQRERGVNESGLARAAALAESLRLASRPDQGTTVHLTFGVQRALFEDEEIVDLTELDFLTPANARRVLRAVADEEASRFHLSPAIAVAVGRYLAPDGPRHTSTTASGNPRHTC